MHTLEISQKTLFPRKKLPYIRDCATLINLVHSIDSLSWGVHMVIKIISMIVLMSLILLIDLRFFFPVAIIILFILQSMEKDLHKKDEKEPFHLKHEISPGE